MMVVMVMVVIMMIMMMKEMTYCKNVLFRHAVHLLHQHDGWIEVSDVEGMVGKDGGGTGINDVGRVKVKTCTKKVRM